MNRRSEFFFILLLFFISIKLSYQFHEFLTDDEIESIFQTDRDSVPDYEVVPVIHNLNKKNSRNPEVHLQAFGDDITLYLWPVEGMLFGIHTPVYTVQSDGNSSEGLRYSKYNEYGLYHAYQDEGGKAAIIVRQGKNGTYRFDGTFGKNFVIRSIPQRIINLIDKNDSFTEPQKFPNSIKNMRGYSRANHHVVIHKDHQNNDFQRESQNITILEPNSSTDENINLKPQDVHQSTVYPEILVILDYDTFKYFRSDISETLVYLAAFWNGVDLRYRALTNPKIRLNLAVIIIALDKEATPYLNKFRVGNDSISTGAMKAMGEYLYLEEKFEKKSYDIAVAMTRLQVCEWPIMTDENSKCNALRGISKYGSVCAWSRYEKAVEATALIHDEGFNGVATAAHEIGHILGVPHDGSPAAIYVGGPGATKCNWDDGYLMSSNRFNENAFKWSNCSIECFQYFLRKPAANCVYNKPKPDVELPRILPGTLLTVDQQCYAAGGLDACYHDHRSCVLLYCTKKDNVDECFATAPAAEGSTCGDQKICIQGKCINAQQWKSINIANPYP